MNKKLIIGIYLIIILVSIFAVIFAFYTNNITGTYLYDTNFELFNNKLTLEQRKPVFYAAKSIGKLSFYPLIFTNIIWIILSGVLLYLLRKTES